MSSLTRWVLCHKLLVVVFWLIVGVAGFAFVSRATGALSQQSSVPGGASLTDQTILRLYGNGNTLPMLPVVTLPAGTTVDAPGVRSRLGAAFARTAALLPGSRIDSYASGGNRASSPPMEGPRLGSSIPMKMFQMVTPRTPFARHWEAFGSQACVSTPPG